MVRGPSTWATLRGTQLAARKSSTSCSIKRTLDRSSMLLLNWYMRSKYWSIKFCCKKCALLACTLRSILKIFLINSSYKKQVCFIQNIAYLSFGLVQHLSTSFHYLAQTLQILSQVNHWSTPTLLQQLEIKRAESMYIYNPFHVSPAMMIY